MPPRHTYWTILFGDKPTAFRSATEEELLPTFKQIQAKHPDAVMMWFARGKLWPNEEAARAAYERPRFDRPRDSREAAPAARAPRGPRPEWRDKPRVDRPPSAEGSRPAWKDKPKFDRPPSAEGRPAWKDKTKFDRPPSTGADRPRPGDKHDDVRPPTSSTRRSAGT